MTRDGIWTEEYIIGVDEAGRGPLAGPVAVGVSLIPRSSQRRIFDMLKRHGLNDSKQVKEKEREALFEMLCELKIQGVLSWEVALVSVKVISTKGISYAIRQGIATCLKKLDVQGNEAVCILEMDGALRVPEGNWKKSSVIPKGDSIKPSIMIASIIAKVTRDRHMTRLARKYPQYGFEIHKGYGTLRHRDAIKKNGECEEHRAGWYKHTVGVRHPF